MDGAQQNEIRDLLLHKLPRERAEQFEDRLIRESEFATELEAEENDLLDDFARGLLTSEDHALVEKHLLGTPGARQRIRFATALSKAVAPQHGTSQPAPRPLSFFTRPAFAIGLAACLVVLAFAVYRSRNGPQPARSGLNPSALGSQAGAADAQAKANASADTKDVFTIALVSGQARGPEERSFPIPDGVKLLRIQCEIPATTPPATQLRMIVTASGRVAANWNSLQVKASAGTAYVEGMVPDSQLPPGSYAVEVLSAREARATIASYRFRVRRLAPH